MDKLAAVAQFIVKYMFGWIAAGVCLALLNPLALQPLSKHIGVFLAIIMLGMGLTLAPADFKLVLASPKAVLIAIGLRYLIMPTGAWCIAKLFALPAELAAGLILVGCCPSGTASNVMTFIARGDAAFSVTVSTLNTLAAPILTPALFLLMGGMVLPISNTALFIDIVKMVAVPVLLGALLQRTASRHVGLLQPLVPALSVLLIATTIAVVVAVNAAQITTVAMAVLLAVAVHNAFGLWAGYSAALLLGMTERRARATAFEIGMENSGLAVVLALIYLGPVAAIPGAIFSVWHNLSGSVLAAYWSKKNVVIKHLD